MDDGIISLTAQIVSAHIANNDVAADQLPAFIRGVHQALATIGHGPVEPTKAEPTVTVKKSVFADHIVCLDCGGSFKMLKRHILTHHQMTPDQYRANWGLPLAYSMVAADYAAARSKLAFASGLGRKIEAPPPPAKKRRSPKEG